MLVENSILKRKIWQDRSERSRSDRFQCFPWSGVRKPEALSVYSIICSELCRSAVLGTTCLLKCIYMVNFVYETDFICYWESDIRRS